MLWKTKMEWIRSYKIEKSGRLNRIIRMDSSILYPGYGNLTLSAISSGN
jgi:hypothetical protein